LEEALALHKKEEAICLELGMPLKRDAVQSRTRKKRLSTPFHK
jgi:hypothetical protein